MKKIFLLFTGILLFIANIGFASTPTKLYRNQQWQFSVKIPAEFEYVASRGPNVIMTSANKSHLVSKASSLYHLNLYRRIQVFELNSCFFCRKMPVNTFLSSITTDCPRLEQIA